MSNGLNYKWNLDEKNVAEIYYLKKKHYLKVNGVDFEHLHSKGSKKSNNQDSSVPNVQKTKKKVALEDL